MRLWHYKLISTLDNQRLLGQHRECCALRGLGWGRKHSTVDYVFDNSWDKLYYYHTLVIQEMIRRGFNVFADWCLFSYRGKKLGYVLDFPNESMTSIDIHYIEHDQSYYNECVRLLKEKNNDYYKDLIEIGEK